MRKVTIKGLLARKLRLALTALAIVLGVTFVTGTLVLGDTLNRTFDNLVGTAYQHVSFEIRGTATFKGTSNGGVDSTVDRRPIPQSIAASVRRIPGVQFADGSVEGYAQFVARDGNTIGGAGTRPGFSFDPNPKLSALRLVAGRAPTTGHEVVMDKATATKHHFAIGDTVRVLLPGPPQTFTITGIVTFGSDDNLAGATLAGFSLPTAQKLFNPVGYYDTINVLAKPGADNVALQRAIAGVLPPGVEVVSGQTVANELYQRDQRRPVVPLDRAADLRVHRAVRRRVHDLQHVLDHGRAADARAGPVAGRRSEPASGVSVGARRGRGNGTGRVADRSRAGRPGRDGTQGAAQSVRHHAAVGATGVRGPHAGRRDRGRGRRDGAVGDRSRRGGLCESHRWPHWSSTARTRGSRCERGGWSLAPGRARRHRRPGRRPDRAGDRCSSGLGAVAVFIGAGMLAPVVARPLAGVLGRPLAALLGTPGRLGGRTRCAARAGPPRPPPR